MPKLTDVLIRNAKASAARREIPDTLVPGLYLIVQPSGAKSWAVRYRTDGVSRKLTLDCPPLDLKRARAAGRVALTAVAEGRDPATEKKQARARPLAKDLIETAVEDFVERYVKKHNRPSTARETERIFRRNVLPVWKGRRLQELAKRDVIDLLDEIAASAPIMANRTLSAVSRFFSWCVEKDKLAASPCAGVAAPGAEHKRDRVLSDHELRLLWKACDALDWHGPLVRLLLLTGQRRDEVADVRWSEINLAERLWRIPRERVKNDRAHDIPLSDQAVAILGQLPRLKGKADYVFTTTGSTPIGGFSKAKKRLDAAMPGVKHWTLHDIRRTVASGMARLGHPIHVVEAVLNHRGGKISGVAAVYNRYDYASEKAHALQQWAGHVTAAVNDEPATVIRLRAR